MLESLLEHLTSFFSNNHFWAFLVATPMIVIGFAGTILPILPGTVLIYAGFVMYGLIAGFELLGWPFFLGQLVLVGLSYLIDFLASAYGVKIYGGSKAAIWGAMIGSLMIFVIGPIGLLVGPLLGAIIGELYVGEELRQAFHAGFGTFVGLVGGTLAKLAVSIVMVGWFVLQVL